MKLTKRRGCRDDEFFANMAVDAMLAVKTINPRGEIKYPVKAVNILKAHGKSATESIYVKGYLSTAPLPARVRRTQRCLGVSSSFSFPAQP